MLYPQIHFEQQQLKLLKTTCRMNVTEESLKTKLPSIAKYDDYK